MKTRDKFQNSITATLFGGKLTFDQWAGIDAILNEFDNNYPELPLASLAYVLATFYFETGGKMQGNGGVQLEPAVHVLFRAMTEGTFTGAKLSDFFSRKKAVFYDFYNARSILNGTDNANHIATVAELFYGALE
jgi:hypothetical protein